MARDLRDKLWWFDVVYPITVAVILFTSLTYIVYSGKSSSRLSLLAEQKLLQFSLVEGRGRQAEDPSAVIAVSGDATDVRLFGRAPGGIVPDVEIADYARVIEVLANAGVTTIFVHLDGEAHPADEIYFLPLIEALRHVKPVAKVYLAAPVSHIGRLPGEILKLASVIEDSTCDEPENVQSKCPYRPEWDDWVIPLIINAALKGPQPLDSTWLTTLLPSISPSFILNLPDPRSLNQLHFRDLLGASDGGFHVASGHAPPRFAFVGGDLSRTLSAADPYVKRFLRTVYDPKTVNVEVSGTPVHVFWAEMTSMLLDRAMVALPAPTYVVVATVGFCLMIILTMALFGGGAATGMFMVFMLTGPFVDAWAIKHASVYMPLFDCIYFGMSTFIFAGFARLSLTAFQRWRLDAQRRVHSRTADLKGNFISLLSHNLNTPVAKMQGMLALIAALPELKAEPSALAFIRKAEGHATKLEYAIRTILIASALEEGSLTPTPRSARALVDEFVRTHGAGLKKLGVRPLTRLPTAGRPGFESAFEPDGVMIPLSFDVKALIATFAAYAALFGAPGLDVDVVIEVRVEPEERGDDDDDEPPFGLGVRFITTAAGLDAEALAILTSPVPPKVRSLGASRFYLDLLAGLGRLTREVYHGSIIVHARNDIEVKFLAPRLHF